MKQHDRVASDRAHDRRVWATPGLRALIGVGCLAGGLGLSAVGSDRWVAAGFSVTTAPKPAVWTVADGWLNPPGLVGDERFWLSQPAPDKTPTPTVQPVLQSLPQTAKGFVLGQRVTLAQGDKTQSDKALVSRDFVVIALTPMPPIEPSIGSDPARLIMVTLRETGLNRVVRLLVDAEPTPAVDKAL